MPGSCPPHHWCQPRPRCRLCRKGRSGRRCRTLRRRPTPPGRTRSSNPRRRLHRTPKTTTQVSRSQDSGRAIGSGARPRVAAPRPVFRYSVRIAMYRRRHPSHRCGSIRRYGCALPRGRFRPPGDLRRGPLLGCSDAFGVPCPAGIVFWCWWGAAYSCCAGSRCSWGCTRDRCRYPLLTERPRRARPRRATSPRRGQRRLRPFPRRLLPPRRRRPAWRHLPLAPSLYDTE